MVGRYTAMIALLLCSIAVQANVVIYQPLNSDSELTKGQWQEIMLQLRERQIDTIALQWSQHEHSQFIDEEASMSIASSLMKRAALDYSNFFIKPMLKD